MLNKIDETLADIYTFNNELIKFDATLTELDTWINGKAKVKIIRKLSLSILCIIYIHYPLYLLYDFHPMSVSTVSTVFSVFSVFSVSSVSSVSSICIVSIDYSRIKTHFFLPTKTPHDLRGGG